MRRSGRPELHLVVWGDWYTVIGVREYREVLLKQKPFDNDDAEYAEYRIPCDTMDDLIHAAEAFRTARLKCAVAMYFRSPDGNVLMSACSGSGYGRDEPHCSVEVRESELEVKRVVQQAIDLLKGALQ